MRPVLRPRSNLRSFAIAAALALSSGSALAQQAVILRSRHGEQGQPLAAANVFITEMNISVGANHDGTYRIVDSGGARPRTDGSAPRARNRSYAARPADHDRGR